MGCSIRMRRLSWVHYTRSYDYFRALALCQPVRWPSILDMLRRAGCSRQRSVAVPRPLTSITGVIFTPSRFIILQPSTSTPSPSRHTYPHRRISPLCLDPLNLLYTTLRSSRVSQTTACYLSTSGALGLPNHNSVPAPYSEIRMSSTPEEIFSKLSDSFGKAQQSGDLLFFPSTIHKHAEYGVEVCKSSVKFFKFVSRPLISVSQWEIRLCPALQNKPALPTPHFDAKGDERRATLGKEGKKFDPFAPPYVPNLYVGDLKDEDEGDEYVVLVCRLTCGFCGLLMAISYSSTNSRSYRTTYS